MNKAAYDYVNDKTKPEWDPEQSTEASNERQAL